MGTRNPEVDAWFERYTNPQQAVRVAVLDADDRITEAIKWQAPAPEASAVSRAAAPHRAA